MADCTLALFNPLDDTEPLEPLGQEFVPATILEMEALARAYNRKACDSPNHYRLLGIFSLSDPQFGTNVCGGQSDVEFEGGT
jgi:hypothetical protein